MTISGVTPSIGDALAQLISGGSSQSPTPVAPNTNSASSSTTSTGGLGPATVVTLSDQAQAAVAKSQSDQAAADRLQAYVEAHRVTGAGTKTGATGSLQSILDANTQATGTPPAGAQPTTGSKVEAIVAQIKALADANAPPPFQAFTPTKSLSNSLTFDGFTLTLSTNASTQFYGTEVSGHGTEVYDKHFGPSDGAGGGTGAAPGVAISSAMVDNNEALDAITITQNVATASSATVSSSGGSVSTSSVNAQSASITFLVNYATGQISVQGSAASVSAQSTRTGSPGSTLSALA
jgi:hypothetical protein